MPVGDRLRFSPEPSAIPAVSSDYSISASSGVKANRLATDSLKSGRTLADVTTREKYHRLTIAGAVAIASAAGLGNLAAWVPNLIESINERAVTVAVGGGDFAMFWNVADLARENRWGDVYSLEGLAEVMGEPVGTVSFAYPPPFAMALGPFADLDYTSALAIWLLVSVVAVPVALLVERSAGAFALLAMLFPLYVALRFGQVAPIAVSITVLAGLALKSGRQFAAGLLLGFLSLKPQFLLGPVIVLMATPELRRSTLSGVAASVGSIVALSALLVPDAWPAYFAGLSAVLSPGVSTRWDFSLGALTNRWPPIAAGVVFVGVTVLLVWLVIRSIGRSDDVGEKLAIGLCLSLLVSPRVVNYDWTLLIPAVAWLAPTIPVGSSLVPIGAAVILASLSGYTGVSWLAWTSLAGFVVAWSFDRRHPNSWTTSPAPG